jgi:site-specific recombinase XerC
MDQAKTTTDPREAAYAFRDGLIIAVLITTALRLKNLTALVIGTHVERVGGRYRLSISADETKTGTRIDLMFLDRLTPYFDCYLARYRSRIHGANQHNGLWPSAKGCSLGATAVYDVVCRRTQTEFGHAIYPHLFRTILATTISDDSPSEIRTASDLLGHTTLAMTDKHYRQNNRRAALLKHAKLLDALRAKNNALARAGATTGTLNRSH